MENKQITHLQERLNATSDGKKLAWSLADRAAISQLLIEIQEMQLKQKALVVIEHITLGADEENKAISNIYRAVHVANGDCLNKHEDWREWVEKAYEDLVARGEHIADKDERRKRMLDLMKKHESIMSGVVDGETKE